MYIISTPHSIVIPLRLHARMTMVVREMTQLPHDLIRTTILSIITLL